MLCDHEVAGKRAALFLRPSLLISSCRGESYYLREHLAELHTAEAWQMKCGREVAEDQLGRPAKEVRKRGYVPSGKDRPLEGLEDDHLVNFQLREKNSFTKLKSFSKANFKNKK